MLASYPPQALRCDLPAGSLFGTDGIRGKAGDLLTAPFALQVGYWAGQVLQETAARRAPVIIGQDSRNSSDMLAMAIAAGLTASGLEVWHVGLCPTPCVSYLARTTDAIGGIMISASHNPPEDNGIKFFSDAGTKLLKDLSAKIEAGLRGDRLENILSQTNNCGSYQHQKELTQQYRNAVFATLPQGLSLDGLKIVLDLAWGASVHLAPELFQALRAEVIALHHQPDGNKINVNCGSTHIDQLQGAVQFHNADLGFAFDGDADRVIAVDNTGRIVDGDYILYLWGKQLQAAGQLPNNLIVGTVMANLGFERAWEKLGGQLHRTAVGDQYVQAAMWQTGAMLGGEQSGHILCHHHSVSGDGIQTALHLAALVREAGVPLNQLIDQSFQTYPQFLKNVRVEDRDRRLNWQNCDVLQTEIDKAEAAMGDKGRVLVRASGTEPVIRVMVEAEEQYLAEYWTQHLVNVVQSHLG
ncbi:phosphoglucosamine mutase [Synechococcus sp. BDU 130192]|uniref:phosphoglucosamine mutase n=1 Tax=Synechococcus sp. BDU 130192 TaxID=2042059 RepID=UPI0020B1064B|nr:phosphoglucosamine mutase [Synechococcus sp. BDU 130192]